jgi:serine/threonine protein kinase
LKWIVHEATSGVYEYKGRNLSISNESDYVIEAHLVNDELDVPDFVIVKILRGIQEPLTTEAKALEDLDGLPGINRVLRRKAYEVLILKSEGEMNLHQWLVRNTDINLYTKIDVIDRLIGIIEECHQAGILHMDMKPANFVVELDEYDELSNLTLIDFGSSSRFQNGYLSGQLGTLNYNAPEQIANIAYNPVVSEIW